MQNLDSILLIGYLAATRRRNLFSTRSEPTPSVLDFLCLLFSGRNARPHPDHCREGD